MGYQYSSFNVYGNVNSCSAGSHWWPSYNDWGHILRTRISNYYMVWLGRYAEPGGLEGYKQGFMAQYNNIASDPWNIPPSSHISDTIYYGGIASGELPQVWSQGRHTNMRLGYCLPPPVTGCMDSNASNYNPNATVSGSCSYYPSSCNISVSPSSIVQGQSATVSWSSSHAQSVSVYGSGLNRSSLSGSASVSPYSSSTYYISANAYGNGSSSNDSATLHVYVQPNVTIWCAATNNTIIRGQSTTLSWSTSGDAGSGYFSPPSQSMSLNVGGYVITPTTTTTYTMSVSGPGGSDSASVTVTVIQPPSVDLSAPQEIDYGNNFTVNYSGVDVSSSFTLTTSYGSSVTLPTGSSVSGSHTFTDVPWDNTGPGSINVTLNAVGAGGLTASDIKTVNVKIDTNPDLIEIPESDDLFPSESPVISPDSEVNSPTLTVTDIDIPIEIKSNNPIQVDIDDSGTWIDVREL